MAKQIVCAMRIMHDKEYIEIDDIIDPKRFTKDQLTRLYERGAVKIVDNTPSKLEQQENEEAFKKMAEKTKEDEEKASDDKKANNGK